MSAARTGSLLLTLAQAWHALSGYVIFITAGHVLGDGFGDFSLVVWTMTTLEIFVVAGLPRAVSFVTSREPARARSVARTGLRLTTALALAFTIGLGAAAPAIARGVWNDADLTRALQIAALDFIAFVGFAVLTQSANGLHRFGLQARVWMAYSTAKVLAVVGLLLGGGGIEGAVLGYVLASLFGSAVAVLAIRGALGPPAPASPETTRFLRRFGMPVATQALAMMALLNMDQWAAKRVAAGDAEMSAYNAAGTLARALFFVFGAFGDALFPVVARERGRGDDAAARAATRDGLALFFRLLIPATGLAIGTAGPVVDLVYGGKFPGGGRFLAVLAPAAAAWTVTAVLAAVAAAAGSPWRVACALGALLVSVAAASFGIAIHRATADDVAMVSLVGGVAGAIATAAFVLAVLPRAIPMAALVGALFGAIAILLVLGRGTPSGFWIFPYGAVLLGIVVLVLMAPDAWRRRRRPRR